MYKPKLWIASDRVFERATRGSYSKTSAISTYTMGVLGGPIGIVLLLNHLKPLHEAFLAAYDALTKNEGAQKTSTAKLKEYIDGLVIAAKDWDLKIQHVYPDSQPEYKTLMPRGRKPFYSGTQAERIRAISVLSLAIGNDPLLAAVKTNVDNYYIALSDAYDTQIGIRSQTSSLSSATEAARLALCEGLQYVKSGLTQHYGSNVAMVCKYFPMHLIQNKQQKDFSGRVAPGTAKEIMKHGFVTTDTVGLDNSGQGGLEFYMSDNKNGILPPGTIPILVPANTKMHVAVSQLGDINNPYLIVRNPSSVIEGEFSVAM